MQVLDNSANNLIQIDSHVSWFSANVSVKRLIDFSISLFLVVILLPFFLLILFVLFFEHLLRGRPLDGLFYIEIRYSRGLAFRLIKFNIFKQEVIDDMRKRGVFIHTKDLEHNGSVTMVGHILKQIYMDELPQILNVVKGDMALVGPRPLNSEIFAALPSDLKYERSLLRAGMTGNFQSHKNTNGKTAVEYDREYLNFLVYHSPLKVIFFDLRTMLRTVKVILKAQGI